MNAPDAAVLVDLLRQAKARQDAAWDKLFLAVDSSPEWQWDRDGKPVRRKRAPRAATKLRERL
jgi:hypothetical protein